MKILALEFSSSQRSVAVVQPMHGPGPAFESEIIEAGGRSTRSFEMIGRALAEARLTLEEIDCIAVGLGPGSYTGIRAAIALAQGWQLVRGVRLVGISTVEILAAGAHADGFRGEIWFALDAQRSDFYLAGWELHEKEWCEREPLTIVNRQVVQDLLVKGDKVCGPDLARVLPGVQTLHPSAHSLGRLLLSGGNFVPGHQLKPIYLRPSSFVKAPPLRRA